MKPSLRKDLIVLALRQAQSQTKENGKRNVPLDFRPERIKLRHLNRLIGYTRNGSA